MPVAEYDQIYHLRLRFKSSERLTHTTLSNNPLKSEELLEITNKKFNKCNYTKIAKVSFK